MPLALFMPMEGSFLFAYNILPVTESLTGQQTNFTDDNKMSCNIHRISIHFALSMLSMKENLSNQDYNYDC